MDPEDWEEDGFYYPSEPVRSAGEDCRQNAPESGVRDDPGERGNAAEVKGNGGKDDTVEAFGRGIRGDVYIADTHGAAGDSIHLDEARSDLAPFRQGRGEGNGVVKTASTNEHAPQGDVLH